MKKTLYGIPLLVILALLASAGCGGPVDQKSPGEFIQGSFFNIDTTGRAEDPPLLTELKSWSGSAWRGERISSQLLVWAPETAEGIRLSASGLSGKKNGLIPADQIKLYEIKYVMTDLFADACEKTGIANYDSSLVADVLEPFESPFELKSGVAKMIWICY